MAQGAFGSGRPAGTVPQQRIVEKLDEHMSRRDYAGAERHLLYWLEEARALGDRRGELMVSNELVGHFRKTGDRERAFRHAERALRLLDELGLGASISAGTTYTNVATAFSAFGENGRALDLFGRAVQLYEGSPHTEPRLLGGLYNNKALACVALGRFREAEDLYARALDTMANVENGQLEQAITLLNMADAAVAEEQAAHVPADDGPFKMGPACEAEVERLLDAALDLLDTPGIPRDGYYAFVCEKCAPVYAHYGYFLADADLRARAGEIYERP